MFCPRCGSNQSEELKFCKSCGVNLSAVRQAVETRETSEKYLPSKPWFAALALSDAGKRRGEELDHQRGTSAESKRHNEIKAGVITASMGVALSIFLYVFMQGVVMSGNVPADAAVIISRLWTVGIIPFFIGAALIVNAAFVSKRLEAAGRTALKESSALEKDTNPLALRSADTTAFVPSEFSVTEGTTKHLRSPTDN